VTLDRPADELDVRVVLEPNQQPLSLESKVVRVCALKDNGNSVGSEFMNIHERQRDKLVPAIFRLQRQSAKNAPGPAPQRSPVAQR
jgi:c-di-GMP-binding flagellar brake protein YcgR